MKKISKKSCYYFYGKHRQTWGELRANFKWEIPQEMNAAFYLCDVHADDKGKVAIFHEDHTGKKGKITFWELMRVTNRLANVLKAKGIEPAIECASHGGTPCPPISSPIPNSGRPSQGIRPTSFSTAGACSCWCSQAVPSSGG